MKIAATIARILLGIMFTIFGLNGFLHFIPMPPPPKGLAGEFSHALFASGYLYPIMALQLVSGLIFLSGRYVPLALTLIGPVIVNILLFHITMAPEGTVPGAVAAVLWAVVLYRHRTAFAGIFRK